MRNKYIYFLIGFTCVFCLSLKAEKNTYYYSYGKKIPIDIDYSRISVVTTAEDDLENLNSKVGKLDFKIKNRIINEKKAEGKNSDIKTTTKVLEVKFSSKIKDEEYFNIIQKLSNEAGVVKASPTYLIKNKEVGISNRFQVKLNSKSDVENLYSMAKKNQINIVEQDKYMPLWFTLECPPKCQLSALDAANTFFETKKFKSAEPEFIFDVTLHSNDPYYIDQWGLKNTGQLGGVPGIDINVENAWLKTTGSPNIKVAVFDSGIDRTQPDLVDNVEQDLWYDVSYPYSNFHTYNYHGTACAGIIGAKKDNGIGISGVSPNSRLVSISFDKDHVTAPMMANGFNWAIENGIDVISCSWGINITDSLEYLNDAIENALTTGRNNKGCVIVFSVGNNDDDEISYPANSNPLILAVGAITPCGDRKIKRASVTPCDSMLSWGSNYGTGLDVVAPGISISTTDNDHIYYQESIYNFPEASTSSPSMGLNYYARRSVANFWEFDPTEYIDKSFTRLFFGTSAACPFVAGIAALLLSKEPSLTVQDVNNAIERTATKFTSSDPYYYHNDINGLKSVFTGYGLINASAALTEVCAIKSQDIESLLITSDQTIYGCKVILRDVFYQNSANLIIDAEETTIDMLPGGEFETPIGSTLEIRTH